MRKKLRKYSGSIARVYRSDKQRNFAFERRKIGVHNRLFYRLSDLLSHQRGQMYGNMQATPKLPTLLNHIAVKEKESEPQFYEEEKKSQLSIHKKANVFLKI